MHKMLLMLSALLSVLHVHLALGKEGATRHSCVPQRLVSCSPSEGVQFGGFLGQYA